MADTYMDRLAARQAEALADWQATRDRLDGNAPALAVLDLHKPGGYGGPCCSHCIESIPDCGASLVVWPCDTYEAVKGGIDA